MGERIEEITNKITDIVAEILKIDEQFKEYADSLDGTSEIDKNFLIPLVSSRGSLQIDLIDNLNEYRKIKKAKS